MKNYISVITLLFFMLAASGCSGAFWGGAASGVAGTGAGYEYNAHKQLERIESDYQAGRITKEEYNIRKDQIKDMSVFE